MSAAGLFEALDGARRDTASVHGLLLSYVTEDELESMESFWERVDDR